ncbi:hypothetical protein [Mycolicibacterium fluoranthenivorans]|uniref:Uncharacterized protein n=1 Tax=Mycolicibacterium fluoranthenivorans TaxID=258505 RepID=A0A7X5U5N5_9MYCO|nr:hypothetical protein [Mycolicibacterium fluoranthenivorans]MCV7354482.1 hypothetical protein [Mycolicibacterium fluoranthenivorans]NIH98915.1 hypothetical protein [Mycolicibacterium fluoranthenivorans]
MTIKAPTALDQLNAALDKARHSRHQPDCRCGQYQGLWCTYQEQFWCTTVDRLISAVRQEF